MGGLAAAGAAAAELSLGRTLSCVRHTELWARLEEALGETYAGVWADTQVISGLDGRTVNEALAGGEDAKVVWRAVWSHLQLPDRYR